MVFGFLLSLFTYLTNERDLVSNIGAHQHKQKLQLGLPDCTPTVYFPFPEIHTTVINMQLRGAEKTQSPLIHQVLLKNRMDTYQHGALVISCSSTLFE